MSNLQTHYNFKVDFQKGNQHTGGKWLIHGTKHHKDNPLQSQDLPIEYPSSEGSMFNPIFKGNVQEYKHPGRCIVAEQELPSHKKPKCVIQNEQNVHKILRIVATITMK